MVNGKILIVDDSRADIVFLTKIMKNSSFDFDSVDCIQACEEYLKENTPAAIILDYMLPDGDSLTIVDRFHSKIPIVLLTGMEDPNIGLLAVKKGAQDFLVKGNINAELLCKSLNYSIERQSLKTKVASTEKMATLGRMSSGIAHEMNTPIQYVSDNLYFLEKEFTGILGKLQKVTELRENADESLFKSQVSEVLSEIDFDFLNTEIPAAVKQSLQGMEKISKLVKALKNFAVNETTQTKKLDMNQVIHSLVSNVLKDYSDILDIDFEVNDSLRSVLAEERNLKQILGNILENSVYEIQKQYKSSQEKGRISIEADQKENVLEIRISDSGRGIPQDVIEHIFDPFFTTKSFEGSLGQGLAIAHRLVYESIGGALKVSSEEGSGAEFTLSLPNGKIV